MNSQISPQSRLPFGIDLDDDITVILYKSGPIKIMKYIGVGEQEEIIISAEGVAKLIAWLNKHATQHPLAPDAANAWCKDGDTITDDCGSIISAWCPNGCGKTMQVVRPGKFQCSECD